MRLSLHALSRFRPRLLTLIVLFVAAAMIALANLSFDESLSGNLGSHRSYGWPLIWHRTVLYGVKLFGRQRTIGWYYSVPRLAADLAVWLSLLGALVTACEWLLRRYRPRPRWSLRAMLVFVGLAAALCGWFAKARNRAAIQDPLIASMVGGYGAPLVFVERWGPKWLDVLGMDRLRRRIVQAHYWKLDAAEPGNQQHFLQLSRLSDVRSLTQFHIDELTPTTSKALGAMRQLQTLEITLDRLTPGLAAALSDLRQLRGLSIGQTEARADDNDLQLSDECLAAIGTMTCLETLIVSDVPLRGASLACLSELQELKSLNVNFWNGAWTGSGLRKPVSEDCLRAIARLTRLERLRLEDLKVRNVSLGCLTGLTNLKTLRLGRFVTDERPMFSHLPPLLRLETLDLASRGLPYPGIDDDDLRRLAVLPRLKSISLGETSLDKKPLITPAGLAALASIKSLEEVELAGRIVSAQGIEALSAVKRLKRLHLSDASPTQGDGVGTLTLDDGQAIHAFDLEELRGALGSLRRSRPGVVIDKDRMAVFWGLPDGAWPRLDEDTVPNRPSAWLPGGDTVWMTPLELADFKKAGGRAGFYGAAWPDGNGETITAEF